MLRAVNVDGCTDSLDGDEEGLIVGLDLRIDGLLNLSVDLDFWTGLWGKKSAVFDEFCSLERFVSSLPFVIVPCGVTRDGCVNWVGRIRHGGSVSD
jgi:hypothetical protein